MTAKEHEKQYGGVYALMLTPFKEDLSIDYGCYAEYVKWQVSEGAHHLFCVSGSAELSELRLDERVKLAEITVKNKGPGTKVFATANFEPGWLAQLDEMKRIEAAGVDGFVFVTKGYGNDDVRQAAYLSELSSHTGLPVVLYESPVYSPYHHISAEAYGALVKTGRIAGIKDTTCTMEGICGKIAVSGDSAVLQANVAHLLDAYKAGGMGVMATISTCGTRILRNMWDSFQNGDIEAAEEMHFYCSSLYDALSSAFPATSKYLVRLQSGIPMNTLTRVNKSLPGHKMRGLEVWHGHAVRRGILK
ncbi:MAG: dihydrodipicolinate synthase family protein [Oscillospiraceae bacterium]|nr:dihydrodipicolinate synthase family protein [Oscillospiraceae bacterium]